MDCAKKSFATKQDAVNRIKEIQAEKNGNKKPIRSYKCDVCGNYHLTSMSKNKLKSIQKLKSNSLIDRLDIEAEYWTKKKQW